MVFFDNVIDPLQQETWELYTELMLTGKGQFIHDYDRLSVT